MNTLKQSLLGCLILLLAGAPALGQAILPSGCTHVQGSSELPATGEHLREFHSEGDGSSDHPNKVSSFDLWRSGIALWQRDETPADRETATKLFQAALDRDCRTGFLIGSFFEFERNDFERALSWYEAGAGRGDPASHERLGDAYLNGHHLAQNYELARQHYLKASSTKAAQNLARMYRLGLGVDVDLAEAERWIAEAAGRALRESGRRQ